MGTRFKVVGAGTALPLAIRVLLNDAAGVFPWKQGLGTGCCLSITGWPRHRENREIGSYFFQTGKTQKNLL